MSARKMIRAPRMVRGDRRFPRLAIEGLLDRSDSIEASIDRSRPHNEKAPAMPGL
jgi:hypothetical protein